MSKPVVVLPLLLEDGQAVGADEVLPVLRYLKHNQLGLLTNLGIACSLSL